MRLRRLVPFVVLVVLIGVLFVAVFPTRTWLAQKRETAAAAEQLAVLEQENERLEKRVEALQSDEEIERLAREQYNLVKPGEEAYALLPPGSSALAEEPVAAAGEDDDEDGDRNALESVWHFLTGWL